METRSYLLLLHLGPVQDFIAASRRGQGLWVGSFLLSTLARRLAEGLTQSTDGTELIFPHRDHKQPGPDDEAWPVANKLVARLPPGCAPRDAVRAARAHMDKWLDTLMRHAFDRCEAEVRQVVPDGASPFQRSIAEEQVADMLELLWVAVPVTNSDYAAAHAHAEHLLSCRKHTRTFRQVPSAVGNVPKSAIDGQRESVLTEAYIRRLRDPNNPSRTAGIRMREHLCGVGVLKHFAPQILRNPSKTEQIELHAAQPVFWSNAHVAAGSFFDCVSKRNQWAAYAAYVNALRTLGLAVDEYRLSPDGEAAENTPTHDAYLLFASRLPHLFDELWVPAEGADFCTKDQAQQRAAAALRHLYEAVGGAEPGPYYAIVVADGDRVGDAIRSLAQGPDGPQKHQALSAALVCFAREARSLVEAKHRGSLTYAGGDDVLALVPLHRVIDCANDLRQHFAKALASVCPDPSRRPTLSVGVAIVHHMLPVAQARQLARDAEKLAKKSRNSLSVLLDKRSGTTLSATGRWDDTSWPLHTRLQAMGEGYARGKLPGKLAHDLLEALTPFDLSRRVPSAHASGPSVAAQDVSLRDVIESRVRLILKRKNCPDEFQKLVLQHLRDEDSLHPVDAVRALANELLIAREIAQAQDLGKADSFALPIEAQDQPERA